MAVPMLPPDARERLIRLAGMLGSDHDGERANAAALATKLLRDHGLTWRDALNPPLPATAADATRTPTRPNEVRALAAWCEQFPRFLTEWEMDFVVNVSRRDIPATPKQAGIVRRIADRVARCTTAD